MKKIFSILLTCSLLLGLVSVISLADNPAAQRSVPLIAVLMDGATETESIEANSVGGFTLNGNGGWKPWVSYWADGVADFAPNADEKLYLLYDITVPSSTNVQFTLSGWDNSIAKELAGNAAVAGEGGVYSMPAGTYNGTIELAPAQIGENGRIGVVGNGLEVRSLVLVCTAGIPEAPKPNEPTDTAVASTKPSTNATEPQGPEASETKPQPSVIMGDANGDKSINMKDVLATRKHIAGLTVQLDIAAADVNNDALVNLKDVLLLRKYIAGIITAFDTPTAPTKTDPAPTKAPLGDGLPLITTIANGTNEDDPTEITDSGSGFFIRQAAGWNVWVLYFNENTPEFKANPGEEVFLAFDLTVDGEAHLNVNGWQNSVAAAIAEACGKATASAEDGTPMLMAGTYTGKIRLDPAQIGENGRLGISGTGATIRTFALVSDKADAPAPTKTTAPTTPEPTLNYQTGVQYGSLGVWWWNANQITNETQRKTRLDFLQKNRVTEIYLWISGQSNAEIADFVKDAGARGMRVAWLSGDVSWIRSESRGFEEVFSRFCDYQNQAAADEKFYGIHLDVEPHQAGNNQQNWQLYSELVLRATKAAHDFGTVIEWDIPFWLDDMTVTVNGKSEPLLRVLAEHSDTLTLMSYRDTASAMLSVSKEEIPLGSEYDCKIILGAETYSLEGANVSFMEDGKAVLYREMEAVLTALSESTSLSAGYGGAIHYVDTWMNLKN